MSEIQKPKPDLESEAQEFAIDKLLARFHASVSEVAGCPEKQKAMIEVMEGFNPDFISLEVGAKSPEAWVLSQVVASNVNGDFRVCEIETGIYGTTSLVMGRALKFRGIADFVSLKFFGKGPMLSYLHAVLSGGERWIAEEAEGQGLVSGEQSGNLMVVLDSLEEIGMQNVYKSVEVLKVSGSGKVVPVIVPVTKREQEISWAVNMAVKATAAKYQDMDAIQVDNLLSRLPWLIEMSSEGFPFTLTAAIPPMDSKKKHYESVKNSGVFNYPDLVI